MGSRGVCRYKLTGRPPVGGACTCPAGQTDHRDGWGCVPDCLVDGAPCGTGRVCVHGSCQGNGACTEWFTLNCAPASSCDGSATFGSANLCLETLAGGLVCVATDLCADLAPCGPEGDCPAGTICSNAC